MLEVILVLILFVLILLFFMCMKNFDIIRDFLYDYYQERRRDIDISIKRDELDASRHMDVLLEISKVGEKVEERKGCSESGN